MSGIVSDSAGDRFTGLAEIYARCRPDYPQAAVDYLMERCALYPGAVVVDVGSGTGIASRLLAQHGLQVIGIEPNDEMRQRAAAEPVPAGASAPVYRAGRAEATGLPAGCADAVVSAQAFHWFEPEAALREFHRLLKPGGWVALMWNERDARDPFTAAYGEVVAAAPEAARMEQMRHGAGEPLLKSPLFSEGECVLFPHSQLLDEEGMLGRALSVSYAPRQPTERQKYAAGLRQVFARFQQAGQVVLQYETTVFAARRSSNAPDSC
jgi:SAM-dependent methyltransferase